MVEMTVEADPEHVERLTLLEVRGRKEVHARIDRGQLRLSGIVDALPGRVAQAEAAVGAEGGRVLLKPGDPSADQGSSFYPMRYVPCTISLNLQKNIAPGEYQSSKEAYLARGGTRTELSGVGEKAFYETVPGQAGTTAPPKVRLVAFKGNVYVVLSDSWAPADQDAMIKQGLASFAKTLLETN